MHFTGYSAQKEFEIASKLFYGAIVEDNVVRTGCYEQDVCMVSLGFRYLTATSATRAPSSARFAAEKGLRVIAQPQLAFAVRLSPAKTNLGGVNFAI